jgi:hypothetical protein
LKLKTNKKKVSLTVKQCICQFRNLKKRLS